jgi:hypothetical protein
MDHQTFYFYFCNKISRLCPEQCGDTSLGRLALKQSCESGTGCVSFFFPCNFFFLFRRPSLAFIVLLCPSVFFRFSFGFPSVFFRFSFVFPSVFLRFSFGFPSVCSCVVLRLLDEHFLTLLNQIWTDKLYHS